MKTQQARIEALLGAAVDIGATSSREVPLDLKSDLLAEGYDLGALDDDIFIITSRRFSWTLGHLD